MKLALRQRHAGLYAAPGRAVWIELEDDPEVAVAHGGSSEIPRDPFPPAPETLAAIIKSAPLWHVAAPMDVRASITDLPPVEDEELAKGAQWEARKTFRLDDAIYDFELLPRSATQVTEMIEKEPFNPRDTRSALLLALAAATRDTWVEWVGGLSRAPLRLEPFFPAALRGLCWAAGRPDAPMGPTLYLYGDDGGSIIAALDDAGTHILGARALLPRSREVPSRNRFQGEEGVRAVRETLLFCEDHHPLASFQHVVGLGAIEDSFLADVATATQLEVSPRPAPPPGTPDSVRDHEAWCVPLGTILGGRSAP